MANRLSRAASRGALVGAAAALVVALGDFGASWLWIAWWRDRWELLLRLIATEVPFGAAIGALAAALYIATHPAAVRLGRRLARDDDAQAARWEHRLWPLPLLLPVAPALAWVAHLLFTGGRASQLPGRPVLVGLAAVVLLGGSWWLLRLGRATFERARRMPPARALLVAITALGVHLGLAKIDQVVYPKLYEYLHALLAVAAFGAVALAVGIVGAHWPKARELDARWPRAGLLALAVLAGVFVLNVATLERNQNVRVALFDPRAAASRSLMQGLEPLLQERSGATAQAIAQARRARERRRHSTDQAGLPTAPGAHVLLVTVDALRADHLGTYGYERPTSPGIDRFAEESIVFDYPYAQAPHSSYSLCSLMTSEYLHETVDIGLPLPSTTLPSTLSKQGVHTAAFFTMGIFHTEGERLRRYRDDAFGFARHDHSDVDAERKTDQVLGEIDRIVERGEPPSLIWVHYFDPHEPYEGERFGDSAMDRYDAEIRKVDEAFDRLLRGARKRLDGEVVVALTADHGEEFHEHGGTYHGSSLYDEQVRVPLILHAPGLEPRRVDAPVEVVDIAPTLLGLLDVPVPGSMRGTDLRPLATGRVPDVGPAFAGVMHKRMVLRWPHKLIADLRFGLFELYDLAQDPRERNNLASQQPQLLDALKGEVYAWLDALQAPPRGADGPADPREVAIRRGHLGDRRAVEPLAELIADESAPSEMRCEGARILGKLSDRDAAPSLVKAMGSSDDAVAAEAAIALGRMYDERAKRLLRELVYSEDPNIRTRAAVSLGRLRDPEAVPGLIDALWVADDKYERREAVRWLGRLRDPRAIEPLVELLPEFRLRRLSVIALGQIGDARAYEPLVEMLDWAYRPNIRDAVARALGQLGDERAIPHLVRLAATEPDLQFVGEALVRLGAVDRGAIGGSDVAEDRKGRSLRGFGKCHEDPHFHDWNYLQRTWCATRGSRADLRLPVPEDLAGAEGLIALVRGKRLDESLAVEVGISVGGKEIGRVRMDGEWSQYRLDVPERLPEGTVRATIEAIEDEGNARLAIDHLLLVPGPAQVAAAHP